MTDKQIHIMFLISLLAIFITYFLFLKTITIVGLVFDQLPFLLILVGVFLFSFYYKRGLKEYDIIDFQKNKSMGLKNIIIFFLIFQVIDYILEDGFIGMISMWLSYWVFGYIAFYILKIINYYKNYKIIK